MEKTWKYMNLLLNPEELPAKDELIEEIRDGGGTDAALAELREQQHEKYGNELIWRFPISEGESAGGFIMPVREGILWIPYDEMEKETGEILLLDDAELLTEDACEIMAEDYMSYAKELCDVLNQSAAITHQAQLARIVRETMELGSFEVVSGKLAVSDPCYAPDVWCRGELTNVENGSWYASIVKHDCGDWGQRVAKLTIVHESCDDSQGLTRQKAPFEVGVDSGQAGFFDAAHYQDSSVIPDAKPAPADDPSEPWYQYCCDITLSPIRAGVLPFGVVSSTGYGDGGYDCFYYTNDAGAIVKAEIVFLPEEEELCPE